MRLSHLVAGLAAVVLLAGCGRTASPDGTTGVAPTGALLAQCTELSATMTEGAATLQSSLRDAAAHPAAAVKALDSFAATWAKASSKVDDPALKAQVARAGAAFGDLMAAIKAALADKSKAAAVPTAGAAWQREADGIKAICGG